jgi:hypothetical protein
MNAREHFQKLFQGETTMKSLGRSLTIALMSLSTVTFAQSDPHKSADTPKPPTEAQKSFDTIKTLAGVWLGPVKVEPPMPEMDDKPLRVSMRVTSRGNALVHEMNEDKPQVDPTSYDHPVTMFYLDGDRLLLTHYCDAGNRPRMAARVSPDGKTVEFDFIDVAGSTQFGHMNHAVFTIIDQNHHTEDWTYLMPGDKPMHAHFDLQRAK